MLSITPRQYSSQHFVICMVSQVLLSSASQGSVRASNVLFAVTKRQEQNPKYLKITFIEEPRFVFNLSTACVHICGLLSVGSGTINLKGDR